MKCHLYSPDVLCELLSNYSHGCEVEQVREKRQFKYLASYLSHFHQASQLTVVVEETYTDRDYLEDYAAYYVRCMPGKYVPPCTRLHFFSTGFTGADLRNLVAGDEACINEHTLQQNYLGFIVIKPLPQSFIGRTCLRTQDPRGRRYYPVKRRYTVHLLGLTFTVESLAFQEQDTVAAACATSALWSVFHRTGVLFQHPIYSPVEITRLATEDTRWGRQFPNKGLLPLEMARVISKMGLEPDMKGVETKPSLQATSYAYLKAGIPLILNASLYDPSGINEVEDPQLLGGHAVAVTGFSIDDTSCTPRGDSGILLRSSRVDRLYVHDDRAGPFASLTFMDEPLEFSPATPDEKSTIELVMLLSVGDENVLFAPEMLILPLYHKIRIDFDKVYAIVLFLDTVIESTRQEKLDASDRLEWDIFLSLGHQLKADTRKSRVAMKRYPDFLEMALPRFVWRAVAIRGGTPIFELVFDATDIDQGSFFLKKVNLTDDPMCSLIEWE